MISQMQQTPNRRKTTKPMAKHQSQISEINKTQEPEGTSEVVGCMGYVIG